MAYGLRVQATTSVEDLVDEGEAFTTTFDYALLANVGADRSKRTELYDSGASRHMSSFEAIGKGDMYVSLPNGKSRSRILLKDVLYAPKMGVTLISISRLDAAGFAALFRDSRCRIFDSKKKLHGRDPRSPWASRTDRKSVV